MGRKPCCEKLGLKRGPWSVDEDQKLVKFILNNGIQCWRLVPKLAGLMRCGKSCRLRWTNYLKPDLKRGALSEAEENQIIQLHSLLGNRWSKIASYFPGRTDNEIKNHWNTRIKKRLKLLGWDPVTHKPIEQSGVLDLKDGAGGLRANCSDGQELKNVETPESNNAISQPGDKFPVIDDKHGDTMGKNNAEIPCADGALWGTSNVEEVMQSHGGTPNSCSTSLSFDGPTLSSMIEESYPQAYNLNWVEESNSFPPWTGSYHHEDIFSFGSLHLGSSDFATI